MQAVGKLLRIKQEKTKKSSQYKVHIDTKALLKQLQTSEVRKGQIKSSITQKQFITLCRKMKKVVLEQPCLLRLSGPIIIATGTLGYYYDLTHIFKAVGQPTYFNYLLLGDYTGRGPSSIQCLAFLFCYKIEMKNNFFLLRGCYETIAMARSSRLYDECLQRFSPRAWAEVTEVFCSLPFAAIVDEQIFCVHGGISPQIRSIQEINKVTRPIDTPQSGMLCDLIWSDPAYKAPSKNQNHNNHHPHHRNNYPAYTPPQYEESQRGFGFTFTPQAVENFLHEFRLQMICRAHEVIYDGFQLSHNKKIATICSQPNYCEIFNNSGAVMNVDDEVNIFFRIIEEKKYFPNLVDEDNHPQSRLKRIIREKWKKKKMQQAKRKENERFIKQEAERKRQEEQKQLIQDQIKEQDEEQSLRQKIEKRQDFEAQEQMEENENDSQVRKQHIKKEQKESVKKQVKHKSYIEKLKEEQEREERQKIIIKPESRMKITKKSDQDENSLDQDDEVMGNSLDEDEYEKKEQSSEYDDSQDDKL